MSFGAEVKDFITAFSATSQIGDKAQQLDLERQKLNAMMDYYKARADKIRSGGGSTQDPATQAGANELQRYRNSPGNGGAGGGTVTQTQSADLPAPARALLDTIAGTESRGYNIAYGDKEFSDYTHHPDIPTVIRNGPNAGKTSSAAGRYQFIKSTWDDQARKLGLKDFSPESQDRAAWNLAQEEYKARTGRDLLPDLSDPNKIASIGSALRGQWTSLPGGIEAGTTTDKFQSAFARNLAQYGSSAAAPVRAISTDTGTPGANGFTPAQMTNLENNGVVKRKKQAIPVSERVDRPSTIPGTWGTTPNYSGTDSTGQPIQPGYHEENGTILPNDPPPAEQAIDTEDNGNG